MIRIKDHKCVKSSSSGKMHMEGFKPGHIYKCYLPLKTANHNSQFGPEVSKKTRSKSNKVIRGNASSCVRKSA